MRTQLCISLFLAISTLASSTEETHANVVIQWDVASRRGARDVNLGAPMVSRAFAVLHTCVYDAWAAYDNGGMGTQLGGALRRPPTERTLSNKEKAISYAAYRAVSDLLHANAEITYKPLIRQLGNDPNGNSTDIETPQGIGNVACAAVLEFRHHDNSSQLGDLAPSGKHDAGPKPGPLAPYSDWTAYVPVNSPGTVPARSNFTKPLNPDHWQPLTYTDSSGNLVVQMFEAHWGLVTPFALGAANSQPVVTPSGTRDLLFQPSLASEVLSAFHPGPAKFASPEYQRQADELVALSANLTDEQKMIAEYWSVSPEGQTAVEHWLRFAEFISERDHLSLDDQVKLFFALSNAMMDADIAAYAAKRAYDSIRPATAIPLLFRGKKIPFRTVSLPAENGKPATKNGQIDGGKWIPYQLSTSPTPPSPEYVSEVSAESAAAAEILRLFTASDRFDYSVSFKQGSSKIEPGLTPALDLTLTWSTFTEAADQAGMSGRYGGIQFASGDLAGRKLGRLAADRVSARAQTCFNGTASSLAVHPRQNDPTSPAL